MIQIPTDWLQAKARLEEGHEVGAGACENGPKLITATADSVREFRFRQEEMEALINRMERAQW